MGIGKAMGDSQQPFKLEPDQLLIIIAYAPRHTRSIVRDAVAALSIEEDHAPVAIQARSQIADRLTRRALRRAAAGGWNTRSTCTPTTSRVSPSWA